MVSAIYVPSQSLQLTLYVVSNINAFFLFSEAVPDALKNACSKCNKTQQANVRKIFRYLIEKKRSWYNELEAVYDKEGIYRKQYDAEAKKEGLKL